MRALAITTADNPYDPIEDYTHWDQWDQDHGYHTSAYLARVVRTSDELSSADQLEALEQGIDEIVSLNLTGNYQKIDREI